MLADSTDLQISDGDTTTFVASCVVTNSTAANTALSQLKKFQMGASGYSGTECLAVPDPSQGFVVGLKFNTRVSWQANGARWENSDFVNYPTYCLRTCDVGLKYRANALADGEVFTMWIDVTSSAVVRRVSWAVVIVCLTSLFAAIAL